MDDNFELKVQFLSVEHRFFALLMMNFGNKNSIFGIIRENKKKQKKEIYQLTHRYTFILKI